MYKALEVLVINWEKFSCDKMEQFLTFLVSKDNEEPKPVEKRKFIWQPVRGLEAYRAFLVLYIQAWFETKTVPNKSK